MGKEMVSTEGQISSSLVPIPTFSSAESIGTAYYRSIHEIAAFMLDRPSSQSHIHYVHPILSALIIRSFPSPSLQCLPPSPSSCVRNEASKTADFIKFQVPALISFSVRPLLCTFVYLLRYLFTSSLMTEVNQFKCRQTLFPSTHAQCTQTPQLLTTVNV